MSETLITITDAAAISGKSIQTIRRAIKAKKIKVRKQKTPQGFNYLIVKDTLISCYAVKESSDLREIPIEREGIEHGDMMGSSMGTSEPVHMDISETKELNTMQLEQVKNALVESQKAQLAIQQLDAKIMEVSGKYAGEREQVTQVLTEFKDRILILENQIRLLQTPQKKWFHFWK